MADYLDEDDLHDYANEDFDEYDYGEEEEITPEDDAKLKELVPILKAKLSAYHGFTDEDLYRELWNNYMEIPETVKYVKENFPKKPPQKESKLAALARMKKSNREPLNNNNEKAISILDKLSESKLKRQDHNSMNKSSSSSTPNRLSKLAALRLSKNKGEKISEKPKEQIIIKTKIKEKIKEEVKEEPINTKPSPNLEIFKSFEIKHNLLKSRSSLSIISLNEPSKKSLKIEEFYHTYLNMEYVPVKNTNELLAKKIQNNFSKPSPDDKVLKAQGKELKKKISVEELTEEFKAIRIPKVTKPKNSIDLTELNEKPTLSFAVIGHVDAGKSTLMGMFLKSLGKVNKAFLRKLEIESARAGKKSFALAWIMDQTEEERNRGVTVDICTTSVETNRAKLVIIDAPGHRDYVPRMVAGVSQADVGLLIIDTNGFEGGFSYEGQTREHALIAYSLGVKKLIIAMNKMDMTEFSEKVYNDVKSRLETFLIESIGFSRDQLIFVPVSGITGDNVVTPSSDKRLTSWYKSKTTLLDTLESEAENLNQIYKNSNEVMDENFVFSISEINIDSVHGGSNDFTIVGRVDSGMISVGETVMVSPSGFSMQLESIKVLESDSTKDLESFKIKKFASKYDNNVFLVFKDKFAKEELKNDIDFIRPGDLLTKVTKEDEKAISSTRKFRCDFQTFDLRGSPILPGIKILVHSGGQECPAEVSKIIGLRDSEGRLKKKGKVLHISSNKLASIEIELLSDNNKPARPIPMMCFNDDEKLGRIIVRREGVSIGAGKITKIYPLTD